MIHIDNEPQMHLIELFLDENNIPKSDGGQAMYSIYWRVKYLVTQQSALLTALRRRFGVSFLLNIILLIMLAYMISGN